MTSLLWRKGSALLITHIFSCWYDWKSFQTNLLYLQKYFGTCIHKCLIKFMISLLLQQCQMQISNEFMHYLHSHNQADLHANIWLIFPNLFVVHFVFLSFLFLCQFVCQQHWSWMAEWHSWVVEWMMENDRSMSEFSWKFTLSCHLKRLHQG